MSYLLDLFFNFSLVFIDINHINRRTLFAHFFEYLLLSLDDQVDEESL